LYSNAHSTDQLLYTVTEVVGNSKILVLINSAINHCKTDERSSIIQALTNVRYTSTS